MACFIVRFGLHVCVYQCAWNLFMCSFVRLRACSGVGCMMYYWVDLFSRVCFLGCAFDVLLAYTLLVCVSVCFRIGLCLWSVYLCSWFVFFCLRLIDWLIVFVFALLTWFCAFLLMCVDEGEECVFVMTFFVVACLTSRLLVCLRDCLIIWLILIDKFLACFCVFTSAPACVFSCM